MDISDQLVQNLPFIRDLVKRFYTDKRNQDDLVSEVCLKVLENPDNSKEDTNFKDWLSRIVTNTFINDYRRKRKVRFVYVDFDNVCITLESNVDQIANSRDLLNRILESLDYSDRIVLILYSIGYKYDEIANIMNLPIGTIKSRIFNARSNARSALV